MTEPYSASSDNRRPNVEVSVELLRRAHRWLVGAPFDPASPDADDYFATVRELDKLLFPRGDEMPNVTVDRDDLDMVVNGGAANQEQLDVAVARLRRALTGGSAPNPTEATRSNAPSEQSS